MVFITTNLCYCIKRTEILGVLTQFSSDYTKNFPLLITDTMENTCVHVSHGFWEPLMFATQIAALEGEIKNPRNGGVWGKHVLFCTAHQSLCECVNVRSKHGNLLFLTFTLQGWRFQNAAGYHIILLKYIQILPLKF